MLHSISTICRVIALCLAIIGILFAFAGEPITITLQSLSFIFELIERLKLFGLFGTIALALYLIGCALHPD